MSAAAVIPRPNLMRGALRAQAKKHLAISFAFAFATTSLYYFSVVVPRKKAYAEFFKNYDIDKEYERMKSAGLFQSTEMIKNA